MFPVLGIRIGGAWGGLRLPPEALSDMNLELGKWLINYVRAQDAHKTPTMPRGRGEGGAPRTGPEAADTPFISLPAEIWKRDYGAAVCSVGRVDPVIGDPAEECRHTRVEAVAVEAVGQELGKVGPLYPENVEVDLAYPLIRPLPLVIACIPQVLPERGGHKESRLRGRRASAGDGKPRNGRT